MLFIVFLQFADSHPYIEELWGTLCQFWPNNLKVILRYLLIISGMAPNELLANVSISCAGLNTSFHLIYAGNIRKCDSLQRLIKASDFVLRYRRATRNWFALFGLFFFLHYISSGKTGRIVFGAFMHQQITGRADERTADGGNFELFNWAHGNASVLSLNEHEKSVQPLRW